MTLDRLGPDAEKTVEEILGYLNFSSGTEDVRFLSGLNSLFGLIESPEKKEASTGDRPAWPTLGEVIRSGLEDLSRRSPTFQEADQARAVIGLVFEHLLPGYLEFHRDLLFHQTPEALFRPFFIGRACEAVLAEGGPWEETDRVVSGALARLSDFIGYRPVAVLRSRQKLQPYAHEWVRPIPLYIDGAGVAVGPYHDLIARTLEILRQTDEDLLRQAWFDPSLLAELALDPRAYDFDHPVNRRPNYHFGGWDLHKIDNKGRYRRFVLQQVTLDSILDRVESRGERPYEEMLFEAAAVLAGTMLMGSGVSGNGPDAHDSQTTLTTLLPLVAGYRDVFYEELMGRVSGAHARRLKTEARRLRQPFGGARQDLNQKLARHRAEQLQRVHLARLFAQMGYTDAATRQAEHVPVASARMRCQIDCRLAAAHLNIDRGNLSEAAAVLPEIDRLVHGAIECGALVDPWNILGFGGQFSLFPAIENSIYDHRIDELIDLMEDLFGLYARLKKEAAAGGQGDLQKKLSADMQAIAQWWDQFASTEVSGVAGFSGRQAWESADQVATALAAWHQAATAAGDIGFWREHVERFESPKAFTLLVESLLDNRDPVASMALLSYWLSRTDEVPLAESDYSFYALAVRWMDDLWFGDRAEPEREGESPDPGRCWALSRKFLDYLEANADEYWQVPELELFEQLDGEDLEMEEEDDGGGLFSAAYEDVSYRDTTDDGFEGETIEWGEDEADYELAAEAERISERLAVLATVARLWKTAADASAGTGVKAEDRPEVLGAWLAKALENRRRLLSLLAVIHRFRIPEPLGTQESLVEYSRRQGIKETLLERVVATCLETGEAARYLLVATGRDPADAGLEPWEVPAEQVLQAVQEEDAEAVRSVWPALLQILRRQPLLYVPTARGGNPMRVAASRNLVRMLGRLLNCVPRLGLLTETYQLLAAVQEMERNHPAGHGAVTEFDRLFEVGCKGIVQCLVSSSEDWHRPKGRRKGGSRAGDAALMECLQKMVEQMMMLWLNHSRNIRISVMESVGSEQHWRTLTAFIQRYGHDLFTQQFMNYGNLRAILHRGVRVYLEWLREQPDAQDEFRLVAELDAAIPMDEAEAHLEMVLEAIAENYSQYIDYNSTTTQSDRGEMLFTLLDFLRIEASYDRVAWNLKPVVIAHQVLVRNGRDQAARMWREAVARRTKTVADDHLARFGRLVRKHGMRLPSVADRMGERFVKPLAVDRLCALVAPAMEEIRSAGKCKSFQLLEELVGHFTAEPSGVGFEVPSWLEALQNEVQRIRFAEFDDDEPPEPTFALPQVRLERQEIERQIDSWQPKDGA
jgi:hypothetical protein